MLVSFLKLAATLVECSSLTWHRPKKEESELFVSHPWSKKAMQSFLRVLVFFFSSIPSTVFTAPLPFDQVWGVLASFHYARLVSLLWYHPWLGHSRTRFNSYGHTTYRSETLTIEKVQTGEKSGVCTIVTKAKPSSFLISKDRVMTTRLWSLI